MSENPQSNSLIYSNIYGKRDGQRYRSVINQIQKTNSPAIAQLASEYLLKNTSEFDRDTLAELQRRSDLGSVSKNEMVKSGREVLAQFFSKEQFKNLLMVLGGIPLYYGSVQYADPRNFDPDVMILHTNYAIEAEPRILAGVSDELTAFWWEHGLGNKEKTNEAHITTVHLRDVFVTPKKTLHNANMLYELAGDIGLVLSAKSLYSKKESQLAEIRSNIKSTKYDPLLVALVNADLKNCLENRINRQSEKTI